MDERTIAYPQPAPNPATEPQTPSAFSPESPLMRTISLAARLILGTIMLVYGAEKLTDMTQFAHAITNYQIIPLPLANIAALLMVWTEITCGVLLISGAAVRGSALVSALLLLVFIVAIVSAMARGLDIDCGCFKPTPEHPAEKVGWGKVFQDVAYLGAAVFLIYFPKSYLTIDDL